MKPEMRIPIAILAAGLIIAIAVYVVEHKKALTENGNPEAARAIDSTDHVLGNPSAPIVVIEYADIDSQYSKDFSQTMQQVITDYGSSGNVAWVFRHFPLAGLGSLSAKHAEASECVAAQGGTNAFYKFIDALESTAPGENSFNPKAYDIVVTSLGLQTDAFDSCMREHTYLTHVSRDYYNGLDVGVTGSPYSVILVKGQKPTIISGSLPYAAMKKLIDQSISTELGQ